LLLPQPDTSRPSSVEPLHECGIECERQVSVHLSFSKLPKLDATHGAVAENGNHCRVQFQAAIVTLLCLCIVSLLEPIVSFILRFLCKLHIGFLNHRLWGWGGRSGTSLAPEEVCSIVVIIIVIIVLVFIGVLFNQNTLFLLTGFLNCWWGRVIRFLFLIGIVHLLNHTSRHLLCFGPVNEVPHFPSRLLVETL